MFGEVYDGSPSYVSQFTTKGKLPAALDFPFQGAALGFAQSKPTTAVRDLFAGDDYYTDTDSNAYELPTFLGNHDMGRVGMMLAGAGYTGAELLARDQLATSLMYLTRGNPVVYYGDEQGFTGPGGDKDARQDMFATKTADYADDAIVGSDQPAGSGSHFDTKAPLYTAISRLASLRATYPALADGAQVHRYASDSAGSTRSAAIDTKAEREYLVVANNATTAKTATFATYSAQSKFDPAPRGRRRPPSRQGRAGHRDRPAAHRRGLPGEVDDGPLQGRPGDLPDRAQRRRRRRWSRRDRRGHPGQHLRRGHLPRAAGRHDRLERDRHRRQRPYRVFHDVSGLAKGTLVEYRMIAKDLSGHVSATSTYGVVGDAPAPSGDTGGGGGVGPVTQPANVSVPGSHNSEMGCPGDWQPDCDQAQLTLDPKDDIWKGTYDAIPAGAYEYKAAIDKSWDENYGAGGAPGGGNIGYTAPGGPVTFYYDHRTHWATSDAEGTDLHGARQLPERARLPRGLGPVLHASLVAGPRRGRDLHLEQRPRSRPAATSSRWPSRSPGTPPTRPATSPSPCPPTGSSRRSPSTPRPRR